MSTNAEKKRLSLDEFIKLRRIHGKLTHFTKEEGDMWYEWRHEFGMPATFHALRFKDNREWDEINGLRPE